MYKETGKQKQLNVKILFSFFTAYKILTKILYTEIKSNMEIRVIKRSVYI